MLVWDAPRKRSRVIWSNSCQMPSPSELDDQIIGERTATANAYLVSSTIRHLTVSLRSQGASSGDGMLRLR